MDRCLHTKFSQIFAALFFLTLPLFQAVGQISDSSEIVKIDSYVEDISKIIDEGSSDFDFEVYADVSENEKQKWKEFASVKDLEKFRENQETYSIAYVWKVNGKIVAVNFTFWSESGDWAHYVFHRFREDGSLAKIEADLRTFYGNMSVLRNYYFDKNESLLKKTAQYRDIYTDKPKRPDDDFIDNDVTIFKNTKDLPFIAKN